MKKEDLIRKLSSRKLWLAVAGFIAGLIAAFGGSPETAETVSGIVMSAASVVAYLFAEGFADSRPLPPASSGSAPGKDLPADPAPDASDPDRD